jgi:hypothetical protein
MVLSSILNLTLGYSFSNNSFSLPAISHNLCTIAIFIAGSRPFQNQSSLGFSFSASLSKLLWVLICRFLTKEQGWLNGYTSCLGGNEDFRVGSTLWMRLKQYIQAVSLDITNSVSSTMAMSSDNNETLKNRFCSLAFEYILVRNANLQSNVHRNFFMLPQVIKIVSRVLFDFQKSGQKS